jgi:hypothetical protein
MGSVAGGSCSNRDGVKEGRAEKRRRGMSGRRSEEGRDIHGSPEKKGGKKKKTTSFERVGIWMELN